MSRRLLFRSTTIAAVIFASLSLSVFAQSMHQRYPAAADITLTSQSATIGSTNIITAAPGGLYNVCWMQTITRAASVSSSLLTTIGWNNGAAKSSSLFSPNGGVLQITGDVGNTLNSIGGNCILIYSADGQSITYSTTYSSTGGTTMQYSLYITAERLQ